MDKLFIKDNKIKKRQNIQIEKDGFITFNPTDEMLFEAGWQVYVKPEPTEADLLAQAKRDKKQFINKK